MTAKVRLINFMETYTTHTINLPNGVYPEIILLENRVFLLTSRFVVGRTNEDNEKIYIEVSPYVIK